MSNGRFPTRRMLNMAFNRSTRPENRMAIAAHILLQQDSEPWKQRLDARSNEINARRAQVEALRAYIDQHPWRTFFRLAVRKLFHR